MPLSKEQLHRRKSATVLTLSGGRGPLAAGLLVLGSGILPVEFAVLLLSGLLIGVAASLPLFVFGRRARYFNLLTAGAIGVTVITSGAVFMHFQSAGLEHATRYGETWAAAINTTRRQRGEWPRSIQDGLAHRDPVAPQLPCPYLAVCHDHICKVAGYYVSYELSERGPRLLVARRDIAVEWNWSNSTWRALPPR